MNQSSSYKSVYRSEIDGLRAFAVLSVVAFHTFPSLLKGGFIGVDVFFVISGFLISSHIFERLNKDQFSLLDFYGRRIRRIFPALILVMLCSLIFGSFVLLADEYYQLSIHLASSAAFVSNFIFASEVVYFDIDSQSKPLLHLWSLAVEEQFYIFFPLLLMLALKLGLKPIFVCLVVLLASFFVNLSFVNHFPIETFFWPFGRFWELLVGSILAWFMFYKSFVYTLFPPNFIVRSYKINLLVQILNKIGFITLVGFLLLVVSVILIDNTTPFPSYIATLPVLGASLVIMGGGVNYIAKLFLCNRLAVWFGLISYPLYLWHWPILSYLYIIEDGTPHRNLKILGIFLSVILAWLTFKFIEKPIRFGNSNKKIKTIALAVGVFFISLVGFWVSTLDLKEIKGVNDIYLRKGLEHRIGATSRWYEGKSDWLFLGNSYNDSIAKLKLSIKPLDKNVSYEVARFNKLAEQASTVGTRVVLLIGPNKSSVYAEYLPNEIKPSDRRYSTFITDRLKDISNLIVIDPTDSLISAKSTEGILYWRTNTHWNQKGSYLAFKLLMEKLNLQIPSVEFKKSASTHSGDLIGISKLKQFPLSVGDDWFFKIFSEAQISKKEFKYQPNDTFGWKGSVLNTKALNDMSVWVIGDSFISGIRPYIEASFKEVRYIGHWSDKLNSISSELIKFAEKPDLVIVVRVERSF